MGRRMPVVRLWLRNFRARSPPSARDSCRRHAASLAASDESIVFLITPGNEDSSQASTVCVGPFHTSDRTLSGGTARTRSASSNLLCILKMDTERHVPVRYSCQRHVQMRSYMTRTDSLKLIMGFESPVQWHLGHELSIPKVAMCFDF